MKFLIMFAQIFFLTVAIYCGMEAFFGNGNVWGYLPFAALGTVGFIFMTVCYSRALNAGY